jgi:geranylgeranyl reductase
VDIGDEHIILSSGETISYKVLIGADGSTSIVRRHLKLPIEKQIIGIQYMIFTDQYKDMEYFFDSDLFHSWYAWIFPHKGYAIIGAVCIPRLFPSEMLQKNFHEWLKQKNIDISNAKYQAYPINVDYRGHKFGNIYLIGDAAGFASDWSGEGIYQALVSGEEIAKQIIDTDYRSEKLIEILEHKRLHNEILKLIEVSGAIRPLEYEMLLLLLKAKFFGKEIIEKIG